MLMKKGLTLIIYFKYFRKEKNAFFCLEIKKKNLLLQSLFKGSSYNQWFGSSVWLEYLPVTQGVAGSSPVRTAKGN